MGILIKGMEMPKDGFITITVTSDGRVFGNSKKENGKFEYLGNEDIAKAVSVPEPHGRLIDADALHKLFEAQWHYLQVLNWDENPTAEEKQTGVNWCINTLHDEAPTIIPKSEEGE